MVIKMRQYEPKIGAIYLEFLSQLPSNKRLRVKHMSFSITVALILLGLGSIRNWNGTVLAEINNEFLR